MAGELAKALIGFQAEMPVVAKTHTAEVPTKSGGKYTYTYADLADITEQAMPLLGKHGFAFSCGPRSTERGYELRGVLLHESGESLDGSLPIAGTTPQEMGSSLTYMRRYLFGALTGLVTDDDDDGAAASRPARKAPSRGKAAADKVSEAQLKKIGADMSDLGMTDRALALEYVQKVIDRRIESRNDLTKAEASRLIEALEADLADSFPGGGSDAKA